MPLPPNDPPPPSSLHTVHHSATKQQQWRTQLDHAVAAAAVVGHTKQAIAEAAGVSVRQVYRICADIAADDDNYLAALLRSEVAQCGGAGAWLTQHSS